MPYKVKGKCVYKKDTGKKVGCTKGSVKKYLAALHANANEGLNKAQFKDMIREELKEFINWYNTVPDNHGRDEDGHKSQITEKEDTDKGAKVIILKDTKVLILKRSENMNNEPGLWDLPGGHIQQGEKAISAAVRETNEETNLHIKGLKKFQTIENVSFFVTKQFSGEIELDKTENSHFKWIKPDQLDKFEFARRMKEAIEEYYSIEEDFQDDVKEKHSRLKYQNIGRGGNTHGIDGGMTRGSTERAASSPDGFQGA